MMLAYKRGFRQTSLADIAKEAKVPLGNVYYYFKTKDEIGEAIVEERLSQAREMQQSLDRLESPTERLCAFIQMAYDNRDMLAQGGCPIGTLCTELHKDGGALARQASALFATLLVWLKGQFEVLGKKADAHGLAVHLLSAMQGIAVLAHASHNPEIVRPEAMRLQEWIRTLAAKPNKRGKA
jgi:AcrR family transcriptional regulator